ncbi:hypothetical protein, partial [Nocardia ninae]|uniref:hypothetical protein n=1 Tax=Nocardia ninae TaxID=356145 RepID=UPI0031DD7F0D
MSEPLRPFDRAGLTSQSWDCGQGAQPRTNLLVFALNSAWNRLPIEAYTLLRSRLWGGRGSNPRPMDYESKGVRPYQTLSDQSIQ